MREHEAFLKQARSDYRVFRRLLAEDRKQIPSCHPLHYLQMSAEKLAKAIKLASGDDEFDRYSHVAFTHLPTLLGRRDLASKIGITNFKRFQSFLRRAKPIFRGVDELNPSVGPSSGTNDGPNTEYPWKSRDPMGKELWIAPTDHRFDVMLQLQSADGVLVRELVESLLDRFEGIFP